MTRAQIRRLYVDLGLSEREIAAQAGCARSHVRQTLAAGGVEKRSRGRPAVVRLSAESRARISKSLAAYHDAKQRTEARSAQ